MTRERRRGLLEARSEVTQAVGDRYRVEQVLGAGGMAVVYLAQDLRHRRKVALKVLRPELVSATGAERFLAEIRVTANLHHPNILPLFDSGNVGDLLYYAMPYVPGASLRHRLDREPPLSLDEVLSIARAVGSALDYAHAHGVIHRDVKPENVLLRDDATFVTDFGVALALAGADDRRLTAAGLAIGTPAYMSPEQITPDARIDGRADQYALACIVYEMLTGAPPFGGDAVRDVLLRHLTEVAAPISQRKPGLATLDQPLAKALAKNPEHRFGTVQEFVAALESVGFGITPTSRLAPARSPEPMFEQEIRFCTARDGVRIAYAVSGAGPPLVKAANWLSHLEYDATSPIWGHWWRTLSRRFRLVRYDERACGLSDWNVEDISFDAWVADLEAVVDAAGLDRFDLLGISKGGAIAVAYTVRHPERVRRLVIHGGFSRGKRLRGNPSPAAEKARLEIDMVRLGWGQENPAFRQAFTTMFFPDAGPEVAHWFNELQRISASPENAARILEASWDVDVRAEAARITCPTLVSHSRGEARIPFEEGRLFAGLIPDARFLPLEGRNHLPLAHEPAWGQLQREIEGFLAGDR